MANISTFLQAIMSARYGKDVRQSIHDGIKAINDEVAADKNEVIASKEAAENAATAASTSAQEASASESAAKKSETAAAASESAAATSAQKASASESAAKKSETAAAASKSAASTSAQTAIDKATLAKSYAVGGTGTRAGEDTDNAKYYMTQAEKQTGGIPTKLSQLENDAGFIAEDGDGSGLTVGFTEAAARENIASGENTGTLMGKIKKWLADLAAAAFMQVITSYADLMAGTALDNYLIGAAAAKEGFTELNGKLKSVDYDITFPSGVTTDFVHCKRTGNIVDFGFRILSGSIPYGSPLATLPAYLHPKYNILIPSQYLIINDVASTGNVSLMYNGSIFQEYSTTGTLNACVIKGTFII